MSRWTQPICERDEVWHRHRWSFDSALPGGFLYHCDEHDPPEIRFVYPKSPLLKEPAALSENPETESER